MTNDELDQEADAIIAFLKPYLVVAAKAALCAVMATFAMAVLTDNFWRSLLVGVLVFPIAIFGRWRKTLEPVCLVLFLVSVVAFCAPKLFERLYTVLLAHL